MSKISVITELEHTSARLNADSANFGQILVALRKRVSDLSYTWNNSVAHNKYEHYTGEWDTAAAALFGGAGQEGLLNQIADVMRIVEKNYTEAEVINSGGWKTS